MRLLVMALLLALLPGRPAPLILGAKAPPAAYASVPVVRLVPMLPAEIQAIIRKGHSDPGYERVTYWYRRNEGVRALDFQAKNHVVDGSCDPAACEGRYAIRGNRAMLDFQGRGRTGWLSFYMAATGVVYVTDSNAVQDGKASPW
jgi:hypothetical protein